LWVAGDVAGLWWVITVAGDVAIWGCWVWTVGRQQWLASWLSRLTRSCARIYARWLAPPASKAKQRAVVTICVNNVLYLPQTRLTDLSYSEYLDNRCRQIPKNETSPRKTFSFFVLCCSTTFMSGVSCYPAPDHVVANCRIREAPTPKGMDLVVGWWRAQVALGLEALAARPLCPSVPSFDALCSLCASVPLFPHISRKLETVLLTIFTKFTALTTNTRRKSTKS
jgi:hypothetical protein